MRCTGSTVGLPAGARVEGLAQAVSDEVEGEGRHHGHDAGNGRDVRGPGEHGATVSKQYPPIPGGRRPIPGVGVRVAHASLGLSRAWPAAPIPGIVFVVAPLPFNFAGDGLREALDPRPRR